LDDIPLRMDPIKKVSIYALRLFASAVKNASETKDDVVDPIA